MLKQTPLQKAVEIAGGQAPLARKIKALVEGSNVLQQHVWHWLQCGKVPPQYAKAIETATGGEVTRHDLRPDIFDQPSPSAAA
jgi:DNA-binding transcriptional regulator YdaS (Cro superfamily)